MEQDRILTSGESSAMHEGHRGSMDQQIEQEHLYAIRESPRKLNIKLNKMHVSVQHLRSKLKIARQAQRRLKQKYQSLQEVITALRRKDLISSQCSEMLNAFDNVQTEIFKRAAGGTKGAYSSELKAFASTLHFYSPKAYNYVRKTLGLALPHPAKIRQWYSRVDADPGFTESAFKVLKLRAEEEKAKGRSVVVNVIIDEMAIRKHVEWNGQRYSGYVDIGTNVPCSDMSSVAREAFVIMAVAINSNWKVPLGYFLIDGLSGEERANIVRSCFEHLHDCGVIARSLTCDGPACNFAMFRSLGANLNAESSDFRPSFHHPRTHQSVYIIFDPCHMLKLVRNCLADTHVLVDPDGEPIRWSYIVHLHNLQEQEGLRLGNKVRSAHIQFQKQKMKVNLAAQTLSESVADALQYLRCEINDPHFLSCEGTVRFIRIFNELFDVLNTRNPLGKGTKAPMKPNTEHRWHNFLKQAREYIIGLRHESGDRMITSKRKTAFVGFLCCIDNVQNLYADLVASETPPLKYLLTYKLSQDHIELFFAAIRACGRWNNNPTARQFTAAYKRLLMRHNVEATNGNCISIDSTSQLEVVMPSTSTTSCDVHTLVMDDTAEVEQDMGLDAPDNDVCFAHLPIVSSKLSAFKEAAISYIAGYVCKMTKKRLSCDQCCNALCNTTDPVDSFISLKDRGGLQKASNSVYKICLQTEKYFERLLKTCNDDLQKISDLRNVISTAVMVDTYNTVFEELLQHMFDCSAEDNHMFTLVKTVSQCYTKVRLYQLGKRFSDKITGVKVRKNLSKLILFKHQ